MDRLTGKDAQLMMEALANVYEKKGDCVDKSKKTKHNCAKKVCSEQWGEGTCVPEHHTLLEDGTVTHYDIVFEHGLERMVPVEELEVLVTEMHEHAAMEGEVLDENRQNRARAIRAKREAEAAEQDRLYRAGGGDAKRQETRQMQGASRARVRRPGMTRDQVIELGRKNLAAKDSTSTDTAPAAPANNAAASKAPAPKPAANPNVTAGGTKFERRLPTMAELRAAQAARKAAPKVLSRSEIENRAVKAGVNAGKPIPSAKPAGSPAAQAAAGAPNRKEDLFTGKPIPSAKPAAAVAATATNNYPGGKVGATGAAKPATSAAAKPAMTAAGNKQAELAALRAKAKADTMKKKPEMGARNRMRMEEVDVFDTIKEYLIGEGATEEEALKQMLTLSDEQRTEILEGSCGSKKKKKSKKGGY